MKIAVLGAGMVGRTIATDLSLNFDVTSFDISELNLSLLKEITNVKTRVADLNDYSNYTTLFAFCYQRIQAFIYFPFVTKSTAGFVK